MPVSKLILSNIRTEPEHSMELKLMFVSLFAVVNLKCCICDKKHNTRDQHFPSDFMLGAASSAYQIEGAWNVDGKGESVWDHASHTHPDLFANGSNADVSANSYAFYKDDVKALKLAGLKYYRFSISWTRVMPTGEADNVNELGLKYYDSLINELLANDIKPMVTIFHWDVPMKLQNMGGMLSPSIVDHLVQYANVLFQRYSDRVKFWMTINEPDILCELGYGVKVFAPFIESSGEGSYLCRHHSLLANAKIYRLYREKYDPNKVGKIGMVYHCDSFFPKEKNKPEDVAAVESAYQFWLGFVAHPVFSSSGGYPKLITDVIGANSKSEKLAKSRLLAMSDSDKALIKGTSDFFAINYYTSAIVESASRSDLLKWKTPSLDRDMNITTSFNETWPVAVSGWLRSTPFGLRDLLNYIKKNYGNPEIIIAENGWSDHGEINDIGRQQNMKGHFQAILDAIGDGCRVHGYMQWSLIDSFEFTFGYIPHFGLFNVDFKSPNKTRTPKNSVAFLKKVIETGKIPDH